MNISEGLHQAADRDEPADGGDRAVRHRRVPGAAGQRSADGRLPDHSGQAGLPGADPGTMASSVASPLERQFTTIAGVDSMISQSSARAARQVTLQFDLARSIDSAAVDVQTAIAEAMPLLPAGHADRRRRSGSRIPPTRTSCSSR